MQPELLVNKDIYVKEFPSFGKPRIIGYIGLENLKFARYIPSSSLKVKYDLNRHISKAKHRPEDLDVKLTDLLRFLLSYEAKLNIPLVNTLEKSIFFCYRGLLTCIACTPYEKNEPWKITVTLYKGNIYLCARDTEEKINRIKNMTDKDKQFTSWGYKFEQYVLSDTPDSEPNPDLPVDETTEFSLVFTTHLNGHRIIFGAEMDGIRADKTTVDTPPSDENMDEVINYLSTKEFLELKTNRHIEFPKQHVNFRCFKTKKWWCQSFFVGINTILCGFRNDAGIVEEMKIFYVKDLPQMSRKYWDPCVCVNFLDTFLTYVKRCLSREIKNKFGNQALNNLQNLPLISLLLEWKPGMPVQVTKSNVHEEDPILPQWFLDNYGKIEKSNISVIS